MNEYPFHPVDNETTRKQALIDYDAKLKGEGLAPIEWTYIVDGREVQLSEDSEKALGDRAIRFFESFISYDHDRDRCLHKYTCTKGLFAVSAWKKKDALREAKHCFIQYYNDGEYNG